MGGCGDDVSVFEWRWDYSCCDQTTDMCHIDDEVRSHQISDLAHACVVDEAAVGAGTGDKAFGTVHESVRFEGVVVDDSGVKVHAVWEGFEVGRHGGNPGTG